MERLTAKQQTQLLLLRQGEAEFSVTYQLLQACIALLHQQTDQGLTQWREQAQTSARAELISFAKGLVRDEAAVRAGLRLKWSQGQGEGAVNRLQLMKRCMYGRATFDLRAHTRALCRVTMKEYGLTVGLTTNFEEEPFFVPFLILLLNSFGSWLSR